MGASTRGTVRCWILALLGGTTLQPNRATVNKSLAPPPAPIPRKNLLRPPLHHSHGMRRRKSVTSWSGSSAQSDPRWARHPEDKGSAQHLIPTSPAPKPPGIFSQALQQHSHPEQGSRWDTEKLNPSKPLSQRTPGKTQSFQSAVPRNPWKNGPERQENKSGCAAAVRDRNPSLPAFPARLNSGSRPV